MTAATSPWTPPSLAERAARAYTSLVLVDMQNDTCAPGFEAERRGRDLTAVRTAAPADGEAARGGARSRAHGHPCRLRQPRGPLSGEDGAWLEQRRKADTIGLWLAGTEGAAFIDELRPGAGETVIYKPRNSAFKGTNLDHLLRERGIRSLIVAEHATNV